MRQKDRLCLSVTLIQRAVPCPELHTNEIHRLVQPGQDFLTKAVIHRHSQEVRFGYEVRLWTGVAGI